MLIIALVLYAAAAVALAHAFVPDDPDEEEEAT